MQSVQAAPARARFQRVAFVAPRGLSPALFCALAVLWLGLTIWARPLAIPDEGRYVGVAWEMARSGHWAVPTLDGLPFFHKPPLFYWLTAAALRAFGPSVAAARAASFLAAAAMLISTYVFARRWIDEATARGAVIVMASSPLLYGAAQFANADTLVAACISSSVLCAAHATFRRERGLSFRLALTSAFAAAGLGVLTKGLIGAVLPGLVMVAWGAYSGRLRRIIAMLLWPVGWMVMLLVAAPWFVAMQLEFPEFDHYVFVTQQFERFVSNGFNGHQPVWFYGAVLAVLMLPWSPALLWKWAARPRVPPIRSSQDAAAPDARSLFVVWSSVVVVFFTIPQSKLVGYIIPAAPALALLCADAARQCVGERVRSAMAWGGALCCVVAAFILHQHQPKSLQPLAQVLLERHQNDEPVFFVGQYDYDVGFYARLSAPPIVVDPWLDSDVARDSWRRELTDAARFAPDAARARLLHPDALLPAACAARSSWLIGPSTLPSWLPPLPLANPEARTGSVALWRLTPELLGRVCQGKG